MPDDNLTAQIVALGVTNRPGLALSWDKPAQSPG